MFYFGLFKFAIANLEERSIHWEYSAAIQVQDHEKGNWKTSLNTLTMKKAYAMQTRLFIIALVH